MDNLLLLAAAGAGGMVIAGFGGLLYHEFVNLDERIKRLEDAHNKRLSHKTAAAIEDAIAVLLDVQREEAYLDARRAQLHEILKIARLDPANYDQDKPNGKGKR